MSLLIKWGIALALIAAAVFAGVHWYDGRIATARADGATTERAVWLAKDAARESAEKDAVLKQSQDAFAKAAETARINLQVEADHAKALETLQARVAVLDAQSHANGGLRIPKSVCAGSDSSPVPTGTQADGSDGLTAYLAGTVALPDDYQRRLRAAAIEADQIVEVVRTVQNWAIAMGYMLAPVTSATP